MVEHKEIQNILIVSLDKGFSKRVASLLAQDLEMFSIDCHDMIVYDLINPKDVLQTCGMEYFLKREKDVVQNCSSFLNTCISTDYDLYFKYNNLFEKSFKIYLKLPYEKITNIPDIIDYNNRDLFLENNTDATIFFNKKSIIMAKNKIIEKIGEIYENC